jgi:hypothetical protein
MDCSGKGFHVCSDYAGAKAAFKNVISSGNMLLFGRTFAEMFHIVVMEMKKKYLKQISLTCSIGDGVEKSKLQHGKMNLWDGEHLVSKHS